MKASQFYISTLKEAPADAEIASHQLMTRAGLIKKLGAGIYNYMPMGLRVIRKVEAIVRDEMNKAGAIEMTMPVIQPAELWQETGRFEKMGPELLRIQDRHGRDFIVQPTSEEVVTDVIADIRNVVQGDASPDGKGVLAIERGIEVGHVFYLGTKYSKAMNATFLGENGKPQFLEMGCYGIGITRLPAAAIEQNHDAKGIIWPDAIAPFTVVLCPISPDRFADVKAAADTLYAELMAAGIDVILDDRNERPGAMFADWELIGVPHRVTIGDRGLKEGHLDYQHRRDTEPTQVPAADALAFIKGKLRL